MVKAYFLEFTGADGQRHYHPEALPARAAIVAARELAAEGRDPVVIRITLSDHTLSTGKYWRPHRGKRSMGCMQVGQCRMLALKRELPLQFPPPKESRS